MGLIEREKERNKYNKFDTPTIKCKICGEPTIMHGTQLCDRCWELKTRIERDFALSIDIMNLIFKEKIKEETGTKL